MTVQFSIALDDDQKAELDALADVSRRSPEDLVQEAVARYLEYDRWFRGEVQKGLDSLNRGDGFELEEVEHAVEAKLAKLRGKPAA